MVADRETIPSTVLDTERVRPREHFALWREALAFTHYALLPEDSDPVRFAAFARAWKLGAASVIETRATARVLSRTAAAVRVDQIDHFINRLQHRGRWSGEANGRAVDARAGDLMVRWRS